ncbi:hypothetical protein VIBNIAM115_1050069 [Vibrio nigripulchritudo AM115]|nr:hypothetical protein VIBNIAM115_1050069 [Vibrio nigripulchritudo AM115]
MILFESMCMIWKELISVIMTHEKDINYQSLYAASSLCIGHV